MTKKRKLERAFGAMQNMNAKINDKRLLGLIGYIYAKNPLTIDKITALEDDKGCLIVYWKKLHPITPSVKRERRSATLC